MEHIRDLIVPVADGAGVVLDRLLPPGPHSDGHRPEPSFRTKLLAYLALVPAVDFLSDCAMFSVLLGQSDFVWALVVGSVIVLFFRFQSLYAALTPKLTLTTINLLYFPGLLLPFYGRIVGHVMPARRDMKKMHDAAREAAPHLFDLESAPAADVEALLSRSGKTSSGGSDMILDTIFRAFCTENALPEASRK